MIDKQDKRTAGQSPGTPSLFSVLFMVAVTVAVWGTAFWLSVTSPMATVQDYAGWAFSALVIVLTFNQTASRWTRRRRAILAARARRIKEREDNTGVWTGPKPEHIFVVRWDGSVFEVTGWLNEGVQFTGWNTWPASDLELLAEHVTEIERLGWAHGDNAGAEAVRLRLGLPSGDLPAPVDPPSLSKPGPY